MNWLKSNGLWAALNLFAVSALVFTLTQGSTAWNNLQTFDTGLESGKWAIRFLLICLAMTPLRTYFGWNQMIKLRKPAGLWSFGFACLHVLFYLREAKLNWFTLPMQPFIALGLLSLLILSALALTSNRFAMRHLRKNWKRLHRLVYLAGGTMVIHAMLATTASKKMYVRDPEAIHELRIYLVLLAVLLTVRIPLVRRFLKKERPVQQPKRLPHPAHILHIPNHFPEISSPKRNGHPPIPLWKTLPLDSETEDEPEQLEEMSL